jgi:hypothetical protein
MATSLMNQLNGFSFLALVALGLLVGCSTTRLTDAWQAPDFKRADMRQVLVVAVSDNITNRTLFERGFVKALEDQGIDAIASYSVLGSNVPTREAVTAYLQHNRIPYLIVTQYGGSTVTREVVPESVRTYYTGPYYPTYSHYWDSYHHDSYYRDRQNTVTLVRDAYVDQTTTVMLTTSIFEMESEALVWAGRSSSFEVDSIIHAAGELARQVVAKISN